MIRRFLPCFCLLLIFLSLPLRAQAFFPAPPAVAATSWVLAEFPSGQILTAEKPDEQNAPASLTKLMTAYLAFSALRQNTLKLDSPVKVSEKAWRTGGSRMFIKEGDSVPVRDLLMGMIVQSGNDASVALAEAISGSEENFAQLMNREAARLGMKNTNFVNATGLPDPAHVSTADDLVLLAVALIRDFPEEYARYYSQKEFRYNNISQPNRNSLLWLKDAGVDGMKTGFTKTAGYCLIASAKRGERRLVSVLLGADSERTRASESLKLLNWGYQFFEAQRLYAGGQNVSSFRVWKGNKSMVNVGFPHDFIIAVPKGNDKLEAKLISLQPLMAPVKKGQEVGTLTLSLAGQPYGEFPVQALEDIAPGGWFSRIIDSIRLWFSS
ncbi:MAG: D-alanyl-D-alanine carboxypeptidase [Betaproteobacteria bacterium]|nr:D-alanyl-D-alanine carboxypeptidase [Betaproteobacteria bacterium]